MSGNKLHKQLVKLDFKKDEYMFVDIKVIALGFNDLRLVVRKGKLGNKGSESTLTFSGKDSFKSALKQAYKIADDYTKKGFVSKSRVVNAMKLSLNDDTRKKEKQNNRGSNCHFCKKYINERNTGKIKKWAETEGNWNYSKDSPLYKKVVCIDCQIEKGIYQTWIDESFELEE